MKKLTQEQINKILEGHRHWINEDCEGWETMRADFSYCELSHTDLSNTNLCDADLCSANLRGANLRGADLRGADLCSANLSNTNLCDADLRDADLRSANLSNTNLCSANLCGADLCDADLRDADLRGADLCSANLRDADLRGANLRGANLRGADLRGANLRGADLCDANLRGVNLCDANLCDANLRGAKKVPYIPMVCPEEGEFIGWKKASGKIIKLRIPEDALRSSSTTRKCRCNKAEVIEIYNIAGTIANERIVKSSYDSSFTYEVGKTVEVQDFDTNRWDECTRGIHFFINRQEAINY